MAGPGGCLDLVSLCGCVSGEACPLLEPSATARTCEVVLVASCAGGVHRCVLELLGISCPVTYGQTHPHSSPSKARLAYAIAADHGCVWDMKFCPSGAWEPPTAARMVSAALGLPRDPEG